MDARDFHHALRIIHCLGQTDLEAADVINENWGTPEASSRDQLGEFFDGRFTEILRMPDENFNRLFAHIEAKIARGKS